MHSELPIFSTVKIVPGRLGTFSIVTKMLGMDLGPRLAKGEAWPDKPHKNLSKADAIKNATFYDNFIARQNAK